MPIGSYRTQVPEHDAALVGIDALNIDDTADCERPAHTAACRIREVILSWGIGLGQVVAGQVPARVQQVLFDGLDHDERRNGGFVGGPCRGVARARIID